MNTTFCPARARDTSWATVLQLLSKGALLMAACAVASPGNAATAFFWTGGGQNLNWSNSANWQNGSLAVSSSNTAITFSGTASLTPVQDAASFLLNSLTFDNTAGTFALSGGTLAFYENSLNSLPTINQNSSSLITVNNNLLFSNSVTFDGNGSMVINGSITSGITGGSSFAKTGSGTLTLTASDMFSGTMKVDGGTVQLPGGSLSSPNQYLGFSASGSFVQSGGTNAATSSLWLGYGVGSIGRYTLSGSGLLSAANQ